MVQTNESVVWLQRCFEVIKNRVNPLIQGATDAQQETHKEEKKKDFKAFFFIPQCVVGDNFEKVGDYESSKQTWEILDNAYTGANKAKVVRLQTHKHQLELIKMKKRR